MLLAVSALAACQQNQSPQPQSVGDLLSQLMNRSLAPPAEGPAAVAKPEPIRIKPGGDTGGDAQKQVYFGAETAVAPAREAANAEVEPEGEDLRINFENAPLRDVVRLIMTDTLHLNYVIDPRVQGNVTIATVNPISRANLLAMLETILRMNGGALVRDPTGYRIVPAGEAVGPAAVAPLGGLEEPLPAGYGLSIIPLRFISAQNIGEILGPLKSLPGLVRIDTARNLLIVAGNRNERQYLIDTVRSFDVDWLHNKSVGIFPLKHADPASIIAELETMLGGGLAANASTAEQAAQAVAAAAAPEGTPPAAAVAPAAGAAPPLKDVVKLLPIVRLNAVLVVSQSPEMLREIDQWIARLDRDSAAGASLYVYYLKNGKAANIARMLNQVFGLASARTDEPSGRVAPGSTPVAVGGPGNTSTLASTGVGGLSSTGLGGIGGLGSVNQPAGPGARRAASASAIEGSSGAGAPVTPAFAGVRVIPDEVGNALLILALPDTYKMIEAAIRQIDVPALQVLIEATIAEVTLNNELSYGLQFYLSHLNVAGTQAATILTEQSALGIASDLPGFSFLLGKKGPGIILDALSSKTNVNVISSPHLVVQDNQEARLQVGDVVPVTVQQAVSTAESNAPIVNSIQYINTGVILHVTPRVNVGGMVSLDVEQEVSSVSASAATGTLTPTISERRIDSTVSIESGQTIVLGGLISDTRTASKSGIPVISDIPLVGALGGVTDNSVAKTELIVFITPHVIRDSGEARSVSEELRAKILGATPKGQ
ncbi:MAG: type II secretion system secretin GspD [Alphaproteobacteria bacterium]